MDRWPPWIGYVCAAGGAMACTLLGLLMQPRFDIVNIAMTYLLAVVLTALLFSRGAAVTGALLCVAAFDYVFVPPRFAFSVDDAQYILTFAIMLAVALVISHLMDRERTQQRTQTTLAVQAQTERIRSTMLASISHDLRTPLAVIAGASSGLLQGGDRLSGEQRDALARSIFEQSETTCELVGKILQMTRLEAGAIELNWEWASITEIAGTVLTRLAKQLGSHRVILELPSELPLVRIDAALIDQALSNLVENAARHTPPGTIVRLIAQPRDAQMLVSVVDHGPGIAREEIEHVFEKFHRGGPAQRQHSPRPPDPNRHDPRSDARGGGVGLGLAICRAIVNLHGGRIWAENLAGGGTAFRFTLPLEPAPQAPPEAEDA